VITRLKIDDNGRELARIAIEAHPTTAKGKKPLQRHGENLSLMTISRHRGVRRGEHTCKTIISTWLSYNILICLNTWLVSPYTDGH
jgi:hypothetical protein